MDDPIHVFGNGLPETIPAGCSIGNLIRLLEEPDPRLIVELNGRFVYAQQYEGTVLAEGDRVELINYDPDLGADMEFLRLVHRLHL